MPRNPQVLSTTCISLPIMALMIIAIVALVKGAWAVAVASLAADLALMWLCCCFSTGDPLPRPDLNSLRKSLLPDLKGWMTRWSKLPWEKRAQLVLIVVGLFSVLVAMLFLTSGTWARTGALATMFGSILVHDAIDKRKRTK